MRYDVSSGQVSSGIILSLDSMYVSSGGVANSTTVNWYGSMYVSSCGVANSTTVNNGGNLYVSSGGVANSTTVNSRGSMYVSSGGVANSTTVNGGYLCVSSGGTALNVACIPWGNRVIADDGAFVTFSSGYEDGVYLCSNGRLLSSAMTMSGKVLNDGYEMGVMSGGIATGCIIRGGGLYIESGGKATGTINYDGLVYVDNGGVASDTAIDDALDITSGGIAYNTTIIGKSYLTVYSGGLAVNVMTAERKGRIVVSGGIVKNISATQKIYLDIYSGGKVTGTITLTDDSDVYIEAGGIVDFDVSDLTADSGALIDKLYAFESGGTHYTITVSADQAAGTYRLADGAAEFDSTITVNTVGGDELGALSVGGELVSGDYVYRLVKDSGMLLLTVESGAPAFTPGDLNGDGRADIIMSITQAGHGAEGATGAWLIQEDQTAAWGDLSQRNAGWEIFGTGVTTAGKATNDVYVKSDDNVIGAWVTDETGAVAGWQTVGEFDATTQVLGLGDFNGDGQSDLLLRNTNGAVGCYFTSGEETGWNYFQSLGDEWQVTAVGDFNGDGRDDVVLVHDAGFAGSWLTQSDYTMVWANLDTLPSGFEIVGAGDFNGDGTDDVLLKNGNYYGAWLVNNGNAKAWMGLGDLGDVTVEEIADFDADGKDDLRIRTANGDLGAQLVKGADTLDWKYYGSVGPEWSTALAAI